MGRKAMPPRLVQRGGGIWYIIDREKFLSTGTTDEGLAKQSLDRYMAGTLAGPPPQGSVTVAEILTAYRAAWVTDKRSKIIEAAYQTTYKKMRRDGVSDVEADAAGKIASEKAKQEGFRVNIDDNIKPLSENLGNLFPSQICNPVIRAYSDWRKETGKSRTSNNKAVKRLSPGTVVKDCSILRAALNWAEKEDRERFFGPDGRAPKFETPDSEGESRKDWLTKEDAKRLLDACHLPHIKLFIRIALSTGARREVVQNLRWDAVDFEKRTLDFGISGTDKKRPLVGLSDELFTHLSAAKAVALSPYVIEFKGKGAGDIKNGLKRTAAKAGLPWVTAHVFKHTFVSWALQHGIPYSQIAHTVNTTEETLRRHYGHLDPKNVQTFGDATRIDVK